jgi:putative flippase GtrA
VSFVAGAVWAFFANRTFTFRRGVTGWGGVAAFVAVYFGTLIVNVAVNSAVLAVLPASLPRSLALGGAWFVATGLSASLNFIGMKVFVFRGARA